MQSLKTWASAKQLKELAAAISTLERAAGARVFDAEAPTLQSWSVMVIPSIALTGTVYGHPDFSEGRRVVTSDLYALDPVTGWARTFNRWYRLGKPHGDQGMDS